MWGFGGTGVGSGEDNEKDGETGRKGKENGKIGIGCTI